MELADCRELPLLMSDDLQQRLSAADLQAAHKEALQCLQAGQSVLVHCAQVRKTKET